MNLKKYNSTSVNEEIRIEKHLLQTVKEKYPKNSIVKIIKHDGDEIIGQIFDFGEASIHVKTKKGGSKNYIQTILFAYIDKMELVLISEKQSILLNYFKNFCVIFFLICFCILLFVII